MTFPDGGSIFLGDKEDTKACDSIIMSYLSLLKCFFPYLYQFAFYLYQFVLKLTHLFPTHTRNTIMATVSLNKMTSHEEGEGAGSHLPMKFWPIHEPTPTEKR